VQLNGGIHYLVGKLGNVWLKGVDVSINELQKKRMEGQHSA
jgi:hypothetical protein